MDKSDPNLYPQIESLTLLTSGGWKVTLAGLGTVQVRDNYELRNYKKFRARCHGQLQVVFGNLSKAEWEARCLAAKCDPDLPYPQITSLERLEHRGSHKLWYEWDVTLANFGTVRLLNGELGNYQIFRKRCHEELGVMFHDLSEEEWTKELDAAI